MHAKHFTLPYESLGHLCSDSKYSGVKSKVITISRPAV